MIVLTSAFLFLFSARSISSAKIDDESSIMNSKVCIGTKIRMSVPANRDLHYKSLKNRYTNCTHVDGNLEITWLQRSSYDLSFLQHIREVSGYVLITHVDTDEVRLPKLKMIRGQTSFKMPAMNQSFGLFVGFSQMQTLKLPALQDILNGSVGNSNNYNLCHIRTVRWNDILSDPNATMVYTNDFYLTERDCPDCDLSCEHGCWGEGPENCQKFSKVKCSSNCSQSRCFGSGPEDCCHRFCAEGCTGPSQKDCLACKNFNDDGECKEKCPPVEVYNPINYLWEHNPEGKYTYDTTCVENCPNNTLKDSGTCVKICPGSKVAMSGVCIQCNGSCPEICKPDGIVHGGNIDSFKGCTVIDGNVEILDQTFTGYQHVYSNFTFGPRIPSITPDRFEAFSSVKEITGYLNVQGMDKDFKNLSCFRNLEVIRGIQLKDNLFASLYIVKTSLTSLGLDSLRSVDNGAVVIVKNRNLCHPEDIDWENIQKDKSAEIYFEGNKNGCVYSSIP